MAVLTANLDLGAGCDLGKRHDQGGRRADHEIDLGPKVPGARHDLAELGGRGLEPIHLPIARDQWAARRIGHRFPLKRAVSRAFEAAPEPTRPRSTRVAARWTPLYIPAQSALNRPLIQKNERFHASRYSQSLFQLDRPRRHGRASRPD